MIHSLHCAAALGELRQILFSHLYHESCSEVLFTAPAAVLAYVKLLSVPQKSITGAGVDSEV